MNKHRNPKYSFTDSGLYTSLVIGSLLMAETIIGMVLVADTVLGNALSTIYTYPIIGALFFGLLLTIGRQVSIYGVNNDSTKMTLVGAIVLVFTYSWFGGGVLTPYNPDIYEIAMAITGVISLLVGLVAGLMVYTSERSFEKWNLYSGLIFLLAIAFIFIGTFLPAVLVIGFTLIVIGFTVNLVYEIWVISQGERSDIINGIALYVAFAGLFVHILQIALRVLTDK